MFEIPAKSSLAYNLLKQTCHRDRIAHLTAPCPSHKKNFNVRLKHFANADDAANANADDATNANTDADAGGSTKALPGLCPGELKRLHAPNVDVKG